MNCPSCQADNRPGAWACRHCKNALSRLVPGDVVANRFEILGLLGAGGMGVVFRARDRTLEETVALKTLRADLDDLGEMVTRFRSEIRLARKVSSRHVCRIHECGIDGDVHFIAMECVEGITVKDLLQEVGGLPVDTALDIATQIVAGLTAIHDIGIMHRDVKPSNLMRTRKGFVKLMDFGIAKQIGGVTLTAAGQSVGTPEYMSPEQVMGQKLDPRTDIYAFGIVLYELLTGLVPFLGQTLLETAGKQVAEAPKLDAPGIPEAIAPLLGRALAKDREARFHSARELGEALAAVCRELAPAWGIIGAQVAPPAASIQFEAATSPLATTSTPAPRRPLTANSQAMAPPRITEVVSALWGGDPVAKRRAVLLLADLAPQSPPAVQALCEALKDTDDRVRFMAAAALGRIGSAATPAIPALLAALDDPAAADEAAGSLEKLGKGAVPALLEVMTSGQESLRSHAAAMLTRIGALPPESSDRSSRSPSTE